VNHNVGLPGVALSWGLPLWIMLLAVPFYGGDSPSASLIISACLLGFASVVTLISRRAPPFYLIVIIGALLAFTGLGYLRGWTATGGHEYAVLAGAAAVFYAGYAGAQSSQRADALWTVTLIAGGMLAAISFIDFVVDPNLSFGRLRPYQHERLAAPFLSGNTAATFYGLVMLQSISQVLRRSRKVTGYTFSARFEAFIKQASLPMVVALFAVSALFLTASRAGILAAVLAALVLVVWELLARKKSEGQSGGFQSLLTSGLIVSLLLVSGFLVSGDMFSERLIDVGDDISRQTLIAEYANAIQLHPVFGSGLGGFEFTNDFISYSSTANFLQDQGAAHNVYLQWLMQGGIVGTVGMFGTVLTIMWALLKGLGRRRRQRSIIRTSLVMVVFVGVHGMVDYAVEIPLVVWWLSWMLGIGAGVSGRKGNG
jgi:O-antigen ligase